ncbi:uncharacterized protein LOC122992034 isoform X3 [Scomber scombrus]|uniref:Uncharacterized protein LOC122992034 isoform X3 n=1 Tax=Scomber scombrus TaxID=13677 RepID=A0AAV1P1X8_SCOSC
MFDKITDLIAYNAYPVILTFVERLTLKQWTFLKLGNPDDTTTIHMAELILGFVTTVSDAVVAKQSERVVVSEENLHATLGNIAHRAFSEALEVRYEVCNSKVLTNLILKEVADSVNLALSANTEEEPLTIGHVVPPHKLSIMVHHAFKMLKEYIRREGSINLLLPRIPRSICTSDEESDSKDEGEDVEDSEPPVETQRENRPKKVKPRDRLVTETSKAIEKMITEKVIKITESLLDELKEIEYELRLSEASVGIKPLVDHITRVLIQVAKTSKRSHSVRPKRQKEQKLFEKGVNSRLESFFGNLFAKTLIQRLLIQLKDKYCSYSKRPLIQEILDEYVRMGADELVFESLETIASGKTLEFTKQLTDLLYTRFKDGTSEIASRLIPQDYVDLHSDIVQRVRYFFLLINWWCKMEAVRISDRMVLTLMNSELLSPRQQPEGSRRGPQRGAVEGAAACEEQQPEYAQNNTLKTKKMFVRVLVVNLLSLIEKNSKGQSFDDKDAVIKRIFEKTWAEVEAVDFDANPEKFNNLDKAVFKDLCKDWGNAQAVMTSLSQRDRALERQIATSFKAHLTPKERSAMDRLFSAVGNAVPNPLRRRNPVNQTTN